jgi:predicted transcriptional regulator
MLVEHMDEGFILSNKYRKIIFDGLASGETRPEIIIKKHRIIRTVAYKILEEFLEQGVVEKKGGRYILTKEGEKLAAVIRG